MIDAKQFITVQELAARWSMTEQALANWRTRGLGPDWTRLGKKTIRYDMSDIVAYEAEGQNAK